MRILWTRAREAIINRTDGVRLQVDYGKDETALVYLWQVRADERCCRDRQRRTAKSWKR
jgi:hypothetical protein